MAMRLMRQGDKKRLQGIIVWMEDLERDGHTYGDLLGFLEGLGVPLVVSPVHDRDTYTADDVRDWVTRHIDPDTGMLADEYTNLAPKVGVLKKPHVHVYFKFGGARAFGYVSEIMKPFYSISPNRVGIVEDWDTIVRYCAHMDSPDKAQYSPMSVVGFGSVDLSALLKQDNIASVYKCLNVSDYVRDNKIRYFSDLWWAVVDSGDLDAISQVRGGAAFWGALLSSERQKAADELARKEREEAKKAGK